MAGTFNCYRWLLQFLKLVSNNTSCIGIILQLGIYNPSHGAARYLYLVGLVINIYGCFSVVISKRIGKIITICPNSGLVNKLKL